MGDAPGRRLRARLTADSDVPLWTRPFLLVCGTHLLAYSSYAAVHPTFAAYLGTMSDSTSLVGVAFGAFTFAAVLSRPVVGWLLDRVGRRTVQAAAIVTLAGATLSFTWATVIWAAVVLRVLHGLAWGATSTATPTIAADVVPSERQSEGLAYFGIVPNVALMVWPPVGLWVAHRFGFGVQFAGACLLALLALGPLGALGETTPATSTDGGLYAPDALPAAFLVALAGVPVGAIDVLLPLYAPTVGLGNAGVFFTVMGGAIIVARAALRWLPRSTPGLLSTSFGCQACGLALLAFAPRLPVVRGLPGGLLAGAALFGLGFAPVFPLLQSVAVAGMPPGRRGNATATVLVGMDLGIGSGAIVCGTAADFVGIPVAYAGSALVPIAGVVLASTLLPDDVG
ncbi:MAG: MFS transporter [Haloferacaceae archaeon]